MPITTTTTLPAPVQQSFNAKLLSVPTPNFIHNLAALKRKMPANGGTTLRQRRLMLAVSKSSLIDLETEVTKLAIS